MTENGVAKRRWTTALIRAGSVLLIGLAVSVSGCFSFLHSGAVPRSMDGRYDQVFQATLEELQVRGFPIKEVNREEGRIVTGTRPAHSATDRHRVEKARAYVEGEDGDVKVSLLLSFAGQVSTPTAAPDEGRNSDSRAETFLRRAANESTGTGAVYDDYLDAIEDRVQNMRRQRR